MDVNRHILSSLPLGALYFYFSRDIISTIIAMASSVVVDVDHCVDYVMINKRVSTISTMVKAYKNFCIITKNYFFLHSWEIIILYVILLFFYIDQYLTAIFVGYAFHILMDQIYNGLLLRNYKTLILCT